MPPELNLWSTESPILVLDFQCFIFKLSTLLLSRKWRQYNMKRHTNNQSTCNGKRHTNNQCTCNGKRHTNNRCTLAIIKIYTPSDFIYIRKTGNGMGSYTYKILSCAYVPEAVSVTWLNDFNQIRRLLQKSDELNQCHDIVTLSIFLGRLLTWIPVLYRICQTTRVLLVSYSFILRSIAIKRHCSHILSARKRRGQLSSWKLWPVNSRHWDCVCEAITSTARLHENSPVSGWESPDKPREYNHVLGYPFEGL